MKKLLFFALALLIAVPLSANGKKKIRVACVGNSVTYGAGIQDREHDSYPAQLQRMLGEEYDVRNFGHSGTTLLFKGFRPYVKTDEYKAAIDFKADLVIIHLGLNDTDPRAWPDHREEFVGDYLALIDSFRVANPKAKIWICRMTPIFHDHKRFDSGTRDWHAQIQQAIEQTSRFAGVQLIDFYDPLHQHPEMFPDALHPNPAGARILATKVYGAITGWFGGLQLPELYGNGMVLQRNRPITLRGMADAGEKVKVVFDGQKQETKAGLDGTWRVSFPPHNAGGPFTLSFATKNRKAEYNDVYVGEVWICSGQSNMEFRVNQANTMEQDVNDGKRLSLLHLYNMSPEVTTDNREWTLDEIAKVNRLDLLRKGPWASATDAEAVKKFSAVAYNFGRVLADSLQVPVGLICNAVGGTTTESWVSRTMLENEYSMILRNWLNNDHTQAWARGRAQLNLKRAERPEMQRHPYQPSYMFEAGILPLQKYDVQGVIWYQGESNADKPELHEKLFTLLEKSWRRYFHNRNLPFYTVQLSSLNRTHFPKFRQSQQQLADRLPNTYMVVTSDLGNPTDVHPRSKRPVGERLAAQALRHSYNYNIEDEGPKPANAEWENKYVRINFTHADGMTLTQGFELMGPDGRYHKAQAKVEGTAIIVSADGVKNPIAVRYAWEPYTTADLTNAQGFHASTFELKRPMHNPKPHRHDRKTDVVSGASPKKK